MRNLAQYRNPVIVVVMKPHFQLAGGVFEHVKDQFGLAFIIVHMVIHGLKQSSRIQPAGFAFQFLKRYRLIDELFQPQPE